MEAHDPYADYFVNPSTAIHRRYELLRARFVEKLPIKQIGQRFDLSPLTVQSQIRDYKKTLDRGQAPAFFVAPKPGPKQDREKLRVRDHVVRLRARGYADTDIHRALHAAGLKASVCLVDQVLREEGLVGLGKRSRQDCGRIQEEIRSGQIPGWTIPPPAASTEVADARRLNLSADRTLYSRVAGIFLFVPFLVRIGWWPPAGWPAPR